MERYEQARRRLDELIESVRRAAAPMGLAFALAVRSDVQIWIGQWSAAYAAAEEALHWSVELGQPRWIAHGLSNMARLDAARGEPARCRDHLHRTERELPACGAGWIRVQAPAIRGLCALGEGEPELAVDELELAHATALATGLGHPNIVPVIGDLIDAHLDAGHHARAVELVEWVAGRAAAARLVYPATVVARSRGRLATDAETASRCFATARRLHGPRGTPFERARTLLAEGTTLRRLHRASAARIPLRRSLTAFELLGARPWAARAAAELTAAGGRSHPAVDGSARLDGLTGSELRIAGAVAAGRSNVEVAAAVFLSPKTVEAHLTRIYRKLGVRSRTELARLFASRR